MANLLVPPRARLSWTASTYTTDFGGYRVYRRPARAQAVPWEPIAAITVPADRSSTVIEAQHIKFIDYQGGWSITGGQWASGFDYAVTALNATTGIEQAITAGVSAQTFTAADTAWLTCNAAPYLNCPVRSLGPGTDRQTENTTSYQIAGRDHLVTRRRLELPARQGSATATLHELVGPDQARHLRAAGVSDKRFALLRPTGDRLEGTVVLDGWEDIDRGRVAVDLSMAQTGVPTTAADYNWPCGLVLAGGTSYVTHADADGLDPASSAFSVVCAGVFADAGSTQYALTKGNIGTAAGYGIHTNGDANTLVGTITGASTTATLTSASATWFDAYPHVAVLTSSGTAQVFYLDGTSVDTDAVTHGAVTNAVALILGGNNGGATNGMSLAPGIAYAVYMRQLSATEAQAASYYLLGYPGYRMPYGPAVFVDLRDDRTWDGKGTAIKDLSGNGYSGTATASPTTRGTPWPLADLEQF